MVDAAAVQFFCGQQDLVVAPLGHEGVLHGGALNFLGCPSMPLSLLQ